MHEFINGKIDKEYKYRSYEQNGTWYVERAESHPYDAFKLQGHSIWYQVGAFATKAEADEFVRKAKIKPTYHYY